MLFKCPCGKKIQVKCLAAHYNSQFHIKFVKDNPKVKIIHYYKCRCSTTRYTISTLEQHLQTDYHKLYFKRQKFYEDTHHTGRVNLRKVKL